MNARLLAFLLATVAAPLAQQALSERRVTESRINIEQIDDRLIATLSQSGVPAEQLRRVLQPVLDARAGGRQ